MWRPRYFEKEGPEVVIGLVATNNKHHIVQRSDGNRGNCWKLTNGLTYFLHTQHIIPCVNAFVL
jgi:hypothetical protein